MYLPHPLATWYPRFHHTKPYMVYNHTQQSAKHPHIQTFPPLLPIYILIVRFTINITHTPLYLPTLPNSLEAPLLILLTSLILMHTTYTNSQYV
jgi:hypothetical protein